MKIRTMALMTAALIGLGGQGLLPSARADVIQFNPLGTGAVGALSIASFDEAVGNAVAVGAAPQVVGANFNLFYQATIPSFINSNGNTVNAPAGRQFTIVAGFRETITAILNPGPTPTFVFASVPAATDYLKIYVNTVPATFANVSAGTGFNAGTEILSAGNFGPGAIGNFSVTSGTPVKFDQFDAVTPPKFATTQTTVGVGSTSISAQVFSSDPNYFVTPPQIFSMNFVTTNGTPFLQQSPSQLFVQTPNPGALYNPTLGATNGLTGPDVQFQADATNSFGTTIPEPSSMALLGIGLVVSFFGRSKLLRKNSA
jgi:hypothetical protein